MERLGSSSGRLPGATRSIKPVDGGGVYIGPGGIGETWVELLVDGEGLPVVTRAVMMIISAVVYTIDKTTFAVQPRLRARALLTRVQQQEQSCISA